MDKAQVQKSPSTTTGKQNTQSTKTRALKNNNQLDHITNSSPFHTHNSSNNLTPSHLLHLQRTLGNRAVGRIIQAKLSISEPDDPYEREADQVADKVMRMTDPVTSGEEESKIQTKPLSSQITPLVHRMPEKMADEEQAPVQAKHDESAEHDEEAVVATKPLIQRMAGSETQEDEETVAPKLESSADVPIQRQSDEEEEPLQAKFAMGSNPQQEPEEKQQEIDQPGAVVHRQTEEDEAVQAKALPIYSPQVARVSPISVGSAHQSIQRLCTECAEEKHQEEGKPEMAQRKQARYQLHDDSDEEEQRVQPKGVNTPTPQVTPSVAANIHALNHGGSPLPKTTRAFFEPRFGVDFSGVRVHTGSQAAETAKSINARAFTVGRNIAFGGGHFAPESQDGQRLLAHELTHTIQQGATNNSSSTEEEPVMAKSESGQLQASTDLESKLNNSKGSGRPIPKDTRSSFEASLGADFGNVKIHTGTDAVEMNKELGAHAFTHGSDIYFNAGKYDPTSSSGKHLLAHELTHTVQQGGSALHTKKQTGESEGNYLKTGSPSIQAAWYNFDIPFTDYQFDPSIQGVKNAANFVKDKAVEGFEWIVDEIKGLIDSGKHWLSEKWDSIQEFASSGFKAVKNSFTDIIGFIKSPLSFLANAIMSFDAGALTTAWSTLTGIINNVWKGFKLLTGNLLQQVNNIWGKINGYATWLLNKVSGLTQNFLFKKLPDALQQIAYKLIGQVKSLWKSINDGWKIVFNKIKTWIDSALDTILKFVRRVTSFGINIIIEGIRQFGKLVLFLKDLFTNPQKYIDILAKKSVQAFEGVEGRFSSIVGQYFGSTKKIEPTTNITGTIQKQPSTDSATETKSSASWGDIGSGIWEMMGKKWNEFKSNPWSVVTGLLMDMVLPMVGNVKDVIQLFKDIKKIVTGPLSAGSLEEVWTSILQILDIPILIYHTVVSILMRSLMVPLIVASFIPHPLVKGIAAAVGYGLLGAFVQVELINIGHKLVLLKTGGTTKNQKEEAYNRIADSFIALIMAGAIILIMLILHFIANVMKGIYNFVKGKVFGIETAPVEGKGSSPGEGKGSKGGLEEGKDTKPKTDDPAAKDLGTQNGKKVLAEKGTADGKHEVKVTEEGIRCCSDLCELMIKDIDAHVADNPALKEKLDPIRKQLETAQGKFESARIAEERAPTEGKTQAAQDVKAAADAAAEVGAKLKPQIEQALKDTPLPSGFRFNEYPTPEQAMGMKKGTAKPAGSDPVTNPESIKDGYTRREYYFDGEGKKWSLDTRPVNGGKAYRLVHESSGQ